MILVESPEGSASRRMALHADNNPAVSRRHALIRRADGRFYVHDLGSANGTAVDGVELSGKHLETGDMVRFGDTRMEFVEAEAG